MKRPTPSPSKEGSLDFCQIQQEVMTKVSAIENIMTGKDENISTHKPLQTFNLIT